jgi:prevent-host-death family protein
MDVPISEAKARLTDLVRQAEAGEEVFLTRHGRPVVSLKPVTRPPESERRAFMVALSERAAAKASSGPTAERSQDFLYDEDGLPR